MVAISPSTAKAETMAIPRLAAGGGPISPPFPAAGEPPSRRFLTHPSPALQAARHNRVSQMPARD